MSYRRLSALTAVLFVATACVDPAPDPAPTPERPTVTGFAPTSGLVGTRVTVTGTGFSTTPSDDLVSFGVATAATLTATATALEVLVPDGAVTAPITVVVNGRSATSAEVFTVVPPNPVPVVNAVTPDFLTAGVPEATLVIAGSGFVELSTVMFDETPLLTRFVGTGRLEADVPEALLETAGLHTIAVVTPGPGGGSSNGRALSVGNPAPVLSSSDPAQVMAGSPTFTLSATGAGFVPGTQLSVNGSPRTTSVVSATELSVSIPASDVAAAATLALTATNPGPGGGTSEALLFVVGSAPPGPVITALSPASVAAGSGPVTLTVHGTGFDPASVVLLGGSARATTYVGATRLTAALDASDVQSAGSLVVTVTTPPPGGGTSSGFAFTVVAPSPEPSLASLSPSSVTAGSSAFTLTVTGTGFVPSTVVSVGGVAKATTFASSTQLTAALSSADVASAGQLAVTATTPSPGGGTSGALTLTVQNPTPAIASLSPSTVQAASSAFSLVVNGSGFVASSAVKFDGADRTTHFVNGTQVTADIAASDVASVSTHALTVVNPAPGGGTSGPATLTVTAAPNPTPTLTTLSPCGKVAGTGAFTLTLSGTGFVSGTTATFNGTAVTVTFVSATQLTAAIPASLVATAPTNNAVNVVVTSPAPGGGASGAATFGLATASATLSGQVQPIFNNRCTSCHSGTNGSAGLRLDSGFAYAELVGSSSAQCGSRAQVTACNPLTTRSYLIAKLKNVDLCSGGRMPSGGLGATDIQTIVDWVAQGALP